MKLEEMLALSPQETLLLVIDIQKDFLESEKGFVFHTERQDNRMHKLFWPTIALRKIKMLFLLIQIRLNINMDN